MPTNINKALVIRTDRLGDLLMNLPVISRLRQNHPRALITLLCDSAYRDLLSQHLDINNIVAMSLNDMQGLSPKIRLWRQLKKNHFDCAIMTQPHKFFHGLTFALGIPKRIGFDRKWGALLNVKHADNKSDGTLHEIDYNLKTIDAICPKPWQPSLDLCMDLHPKFQIWAKDFGLREEKQVILFHMTSSNSKKEIPLMIFKQAMDLLHQKRRYQVILVGNEKKEEINGMFGVGETPYFKNLVGKTSLAQLAVLIKHAGCVVSLDSGPMHLAWMQSTPVVGIFSKSAAGSNPTRWGVYPRTCPHIHIYKNPFQITAEEIADSAMSLSQAVI